MAIGDIKDFLKFLWENFELFIRRFIMPSSVFFVMLFGVYWHNDPSLKGIASIKGFYDLNFWGFVSLFLILSAVSYTLKVVSQILFDNLMKYDFNPTFLYNKDEKESYLMLRKAVWKKIQKKKSLGENFDYDVEIEKHNDQLLYQILGEILKSDKRYATDAKEMGVAALSMMSALILYGWLHNDWIVLVVLLPIYYFSLQAIKSKYRSRAYRLYVNYLLMEE